METQTTHQIANKMSIWTNGEHKVMVNLNPNNVVNEADQNEAAAQRNTAPRHTMKFRCAKVNMRHDISVTGNRRKAKVNTKGTGKQRRETETKDNGAKYFFPAPGCGDPIVKMQTQMEICKLKGGGR